MFWRILSGVILLFWAVMTGLLIRDTYFPDHSRFAVVPVQMIFDLFLKDAAAFNNTLHIYHGKEKIGHASFNIRLLEEAAGEPVYGILANGSVNVPTEVGSVNAVFSLNGRLLRAESWQDFKVEVKAPASQMQGLISWKQGDTLPELEVKKAGQVVMNTEMARAMLSLSESLGGKADLLAGMLPAGALSESSAKRLSAREGQMDLAGKRRRCYVVTMTFLQGYEMQMFFTELGELARIDLPQDYRLIEPLMHGLEASLNSFE